MAVVKCPSCGQAVDVPEKTSALPWLIGCLVALLVIPVVVAMVGLMAAIAIPSFVKARQTAQMNACIGNMRLIDSAKEQWAISADIGAGQPVDVKSVNQYIKGAATPVCPARGTYTYHNFGQDPECSVHGRLSEPKRLGPAFGRPPDS